MLQSIEKVRYIDSNIKTGLVPFPIMNFDSENLVYKINYKSTMTAQWKTNGKFT